MVNEQKQNISRGQLVNFLAMGVSLFLLFNSGEGIGNNAPSLYLGLGIFIAFGLAVLPKL